MHLNVLCMFERNVVTKEYIMLKIIHHVLQLSHKLYGKVRDFGFVFIILVKSVNLQSHRSQI